MGKGLSPTQRTLKAMREQGRLVGTVERWNPHVGQHGIRQDLFGFIDLIAIDPTEGIVAVQSCGQSLAEHLRKLDQDRNEAVYEWLKHARLEVWSWRKVLLKRGSKALRWRPRVVDVTTDKSGFLKFKER